MGFRYVRLNGYETLFTLRTQKRKGQLSTSVNPDFAVKMLL